MRSKTTLHRPYARVEPDDGSVRIDPETLAVAVALANGSPGPPTPTVQSHLATLVESGLAEPAVGDHPPALSPVFESVASVIGSARVRVDATRFRGATMLEATLLITGDLAVLVEHHSDAATVILSSFPISVAARRIARFVGLDDQAGAAGDTFALSPATLARFHERLIAGDGPAAAAVLSSDSGLSRRELCLLLDLVLGRCHSWLVATADSSVVVVDGGAGGLWLSARDGGNGADELAPATAEAATAAIDRLLLRVPGVRTDETPPSEVAA